MPADEYGTFVSVFLQLLARVNPKEGEDQREYAKRIFVLAREEVWRYFDPQG